MELEADNNVLPFFFKNDYVIPNKQSGQYIRPYEVCNAAANVIDLKMLKVPNKLEICGGFILKMKMPETIF